MLTAFSFLQMDLSSYDQVIGAVNEQGNHWVLLVRNIIYILKYGGFV